MRCFTDLEILKEIAHRILYSNQIRMGTKREVNNVCFPSGAVVLTILCIYYGAADERIACASVSFQD
jgi:hypothetical protein